MIATAIIMELTASLAFAWGDGDEADLIPIANCLVDAMYEHGIDCPSGPVLSVGHARFREGHLVDHFACLVKLGEGDIHVSWKFVGHPMVGGGGVADRDMLLIDYRIEIRSTGQIIAFRHASES
jgi:hypothetical protein